MRYTSFTLLVFIYLVGCSKRTYDRAERFYEYGGERYRIHTSIEGIKRNADVYAIDLSNNSLSSFPKRLEEFPHLILLDLRHNQLTTLDEGLCKLSNLKALLLGGNQMKTLPSCVYDMTQLEVLTMFGCRMDISKESFAKLVNLRFLGMGGNNFSEEDLNFLKEHLPNCRIIVSVD
jgi:hypothetical protein